MRRLTEAEIKVKDFITKDFILGVAETMLDSLDDETKMEVIDNILPKQNYQLYSEQHKNFVVLNVKNKGVPKMSRLAYELAKKFNKDEDDIEKWLDENFYDIWQSNVQFYLENLDYENEVYVAGRSGGYWGFELSKFEFEVDNSKLESIILKYYLKELEEQIEETFGTDEVKNGVMLSYDDGYVFTQEFVRDSNKLIDSISLEDKGFKDLVNFELELNAESKEWEKAEHWIEEFESNEWLSDLPDKA